MRELVYVSSAKLRQLLPDLPRGTGSLRDVDAEVTTPVGGFKIGKAARKPEPGLAEAVAALTASSRAPRWFADPEARPGYWVHFEALLSWCTLPGSVVFVDPEVGSAKYPSGERLRLLLHGSSGHVLGAAPPRLDRVTEGGSQWFAFLRALRRVDRLEEDGESLALDNRWPSQIRRHLDCLSVMLQPPFTAAWLAGYARVTAVIPDGRYTVVAATPLYVEHIDPPDDLVEH
jgi:hypothetical protein